MPPSENGRENNSATWHWPTKCRGGLVSHKPNYGGKKGPGGHRQKRMEAALTKVFNLLFLVYRIGFEVGFSEGKRQTTTGCGPAVSAGTKHRKRSATHRAAENK
jgi:hypothetical protein